MSSFLIVTMMIMSCAIAADTYEIADTEEGISGSVYDSETLESFEGVSLVQSSEQDDLFKSALIHFEDTSKEYCSNEKVYWTFYAYLDGAGSRSATKNAQSLLYEELETNNVCKVTTVLKDRTTMHTAYHGQNYYSMKDSGYSYKYTSGQHWIIYHGIAPGKYLLYISAKCDGPTYKFNYEQLVDYDFITIKDCAVTPTCDDDYYFCKQERSYKKVFDASNDCVSSDIIDTNIVRNTICKKSYCESQNKFWYDNACHTEKQCTPSWSCGDWGACNSETSSKMRYCNDGCGRTKSETDSCTVDDPDVSICGNGECEKGEYDYNCPEDCKDDDDDERRCGDKICDPEIDENHENCPSDCIETYRCGDNECNNEETIETCPEDCKDEEYCGDGYCNKMTESCDNCPTDCGICALCLNDNDCTPEKADKCIEYSCYEGSCKEVYLRTEECMPSQWALIWKDYKLWIIGGGMISFLLTFGVVILFILGVIYLLVRKKK